MKNFIKMNNNNNHFSIGNLCRIIKENSLNKTFANQTDIFCNIFNIDSINDSTVNNYCIGYRSIGSEYKEIFQDYQKKYNKNPFILINNILNIVSILDGYFYDNENDETSYKLINQNSNFKTICNSLYNISKNDFSVNNDFSIGLKKLMDKNKYYETFCQMLFYIILEKKQPIYIEKLVNDTMETLLNNTNISINELEKFLKLQLTDGINYTYSIKKLANEENPYATFALGEMEYYGEIVGYPRYNKAFEYFKIAAEKSHPRANWMIAQMIYKKKIGKKSNDDLKLAWKYLKNAQNYGSVAALNTIGLFYKEGLVPNHNADIEKAKEYFNEAATYDYVFAFNNLGDIYENEKDFTKAFEFYLKSADLEESWACNKVGEFYRLGIGTKKDLKKAFEYYNLSQNVPIKMMYYFSKYNLAKHFYLNGNYEAKIEKDEDKAILLFKEASDNGILKATEELIYIYADKYLKTRNSNYKTLMNKYIKEIESSNNFNMDIKKNVEKKLSQLQKINNIIS